MRLLPHVVLCAWWSSLGTPTSPSSESDSDSEAVSARRKMVKRLSFLALGSKQDVASLERRKRLLKRELQDARELNFVDDVKKFEQELAQIENEERTAACRRLQTWWIRKKMRARLQNLQQADDLALAAAQFAAKKAARSSDADDFDGQTEGVRFLRVALLFAFWFLALPRLLSACASREPAACVSSSA